MRYQITGETLPVLEIYLKKGETIKSEAGGKSWYLGNVKVENNSNGGGFGKMLGRVVTGESILFSYYTAIEDSALVAFSNNFPGQIIPIELNGSKSIIAQKNAMLCMDPNIQISTHTNNLGTSLFGGEGIFMQKFSGQGILFLEIDGTCFQYDLKPEQSITVDTGLVAAFEDTVNMKIERVKSVKNIFLGGEGLFNTTLTGPGRIYLQSMSMPGLVKSLSPYLQSK